MANPFAGNLNTDRKGGNPAPVTGRKKAARIDQGREKPAFPSAELPGDTQPKDRSGNTRKAKVHPSSKGL